MPLSPEQRLFAEQALFQGLWNPPAATKDDLRLALDAAFDWINTPAVRQSFNTTLPQIFQDEATTDQKTALLLFVLEATLFIA